MWAYILVVACALYGHGAVGRSHYHSLESEIFDISLWINKDQGRRSKVIFSPQTKHFFIPIVVKLFSGYSMQIFAIENGKVNQHLKDPNISAYLPTIPSAVSYVNFTWSSGGSKKYTYHFDRLTSSDETLLKPPTISIDLMGQIPKTPQGA